MLAQNEGATNVNILNKAILITGGGSGLGAATANLFVQHGGRVVLCDINQEAGEAVSEALGDAARYLSCDVSKEEDVAAAIALARSEFGRIDGAVSCAGIGTPAKVVGRKGVHSLDLFRKILEVNLLGTFNVVRLVGEALMENTPSDDGERGVLVNTASVAAFEGQIGQAAYSASKGGIVGMTLPIAREFAKHGIRVVTIAPGLFNTPLLAGLPEAARESLGQQVPFPSRLGEPSEYAQLAKTIFENSMLNGTTIRLDGAIRMQPK